MTAESFNPYVGPRPFSTADRDRFFGRDQEARDLVPMVIAEKLVLFHAQSGAGKSSLINARLIPMLEERNFIVLPVARVSGEAVQSGAENVYMQNLLLSLEQADNGGEARKAALASMTLQEYTASLDLDAGEQAEPKGPVPVDAPQIVGGVRPLALIIDQFEEIFTTHPEAWKQRAPFFTQLAQAMDADPYLWIVLAIREDFVGALDPYVHLLPNRLRARFSMQRMGTFAALEGVRRPVAEIKPFEPGVAEKLVDNLRLVATGVTENGEPIYIEGQYIEPVQLQVVCYQLWENLRDDTGATITAEDLERLAGGSDLAQFISRALADFYEKAIVRVAQNPENPISERKIRDWFTRELITEAETRGSVFMGERATGSLPNEVVRQLEGQFVVRAETRAAGKWYELSHDRFIGPILQANRAWYERNPRPIMGDAEAWLAANRPPGKLYEGRQLTQAVRQLETESDSLSDLEREFIQASQAAADRQRQRRQRIGITLLAALVLVLLGLTAASAVGFSNAVRNEGIANQERTNVFRQKETADAAVWIVNTERAEADRQRVLAEDQKATAEAYSAELVVQQVAEQNARSTAEAASIRAEQERAQADIARDEAESARNEAEAGRLASLSDYFRNSTLDLSLLLAVDAVDLSDDWVTRAALFNSIQRGLSNRIDPLGAPVFLPQRPYSIAFRPPSGDRYAVGYSDGTVEVFTTAGGRGRASVPQNFRATGQIFALSYSSDGSTLALGSIDGNVRLWNLNNNTVTTVRGLPFTVPSIFALSFQPGGDLLAIATQREQGSPVGRVLFYNITTNSLEAQTWDCGQYDCTVLTWTPDGKYLGVANKGGGIKILNTDTFEEIFSFDRAHVDQIYGLAWQPGGQIIYSAGIDQRIKAWDVSKREMLNQSDRTVTPVIISMAISPNGRFLVVGASDPKQIGWTSIWDAESLTLLDVPTTDHSQGISAVAFQAQGGSFATASYDSSVRLWSYTPTDPLSQPVVTLPNGRPGAFLLDGSGLLAVQSTGNNQVQVFDQTGSALGVGQGSHSSLAMLQINGQPVVALGGFDGRITLLDAQSGQPVGEPISLAAGSLRSIAAREDGSLIAAAACTSAQQCGSIIFYDRAAGQVLPLPGDLGAYDFGLVTSLALHPTKPELAIGNGTGQIYFYNFETGAVEQPFSQGAPGSQRSVTSVAYSPVEQDIFAAGYSDGRLVLWEASKRAPIGEFSERMSGEISALVFRQDANGLLTLVAAGSTGEVREFQVDVRVWQQRACQLAARDMTDEEKARFRTVGDRTAATCPR